MVEFQHAPQNANERPIMGRVPLLMAASLALGSLIMAGVASYTGFGAARMQETSVVASRDFILVDGEDGRGLIKDATDKSLIMAMQPGVTGFLHMVIRAVAQERLAAGGSPEAPFRIARHADGHLIVTDLLTGTRRVVDTFGPANTALFERLMPAAQK
jgi:putative photosynthetic complex assembly protein